MLDAFRYLLCSKLCWHNRPEPNADGVSLLHFPRYPSLRRKWNQQVQRTRADWKDATEYSVLCSEHFTNECFEEDSFIARHQPIMLIFHLLCYAAVLKIKTYYAQYYAHVCLKCDCSIRVYSQNY